MDQLIICDTTLRDGEQAPGCHLGPADKLQVAWQLQRLGVDIIEAGFPASSPGELEAVRQIAQTVGQEAPEGRSLDLRVAWKKISINAGKQFARRSVHVCIYS